MIDHHKLPEKGDIQHQLDPFLDHLDEHMDPFSDETPIDVADVFDDDHDLSEQEQRPGQYREASSSGLIVKTLIGAGFVSAAMLWFAWPIEQTSAPDVMRQPHSFDVSRSIPKIESTADKPVVIQGAGEPAVAKAERLDAPDEPKQINVAAQPARVVQAVRADQIVTVEQTARPVVGGGSAARSTAAATVKLVVAVRVGNIRSRPGRSAKVLYKLVQGAEVTKLAEQKDWFQVRLRNGTVAWAHHSIFAIIQHNKD